MFLQENLLFSTLILGSVSAIMLSVTGIIKFCTQYDILVYGWQTTPKSGMVSVIWPIFQFRCPQSYLRNGWCESRQILFACTMYQVLASG